MPEPHRTTCRVAYADTDRMDRVYYANYLVYAERARTEMLRDAGHPYRSLEEQGFFLPVRECSVRYRGAAVYDDLLELSTVVRALRHAAVVCVTDIRRAGETAVLATATVELACVDRTGKPTPFPPAFRDALERHLAGDES